jgi:ABC-type branched-subunit amino acid transport system ATPase component
MALDIASRATLLELGSIVLEGDARDVAQSERLMSAYLGEN